MPFKKEEYVQELKKEAIPLREEKDLEPLIQALSRKKIVMLGESSHGTSEFYRWRSSITQELVSHHNFNFIAFEADWPPCQKVDSYIKNPENLNTVDVLSSFNRWPTWMWANNEIVDLVNYLKFENHGVKNKIGFHGLDVYSLFESLDEVANQLRRKNPSLYQNAQKYFSCLSHYSHDEMSYARSLFKAPEGCKNEILDFLQQALDARIKDGGKHRSEYLDIIQNAKIIRNAEAYYRAMVFGEDNSWNVRDNHMLDTIESLMEHYGPDTKAIVWAHNTHIGDYRATDMTTRGEVNLGGLAREVFGEEHVALVGFGTYTGTVIASKAWDGPTQIFSLPTAKPGSIEDEFHKVAQNIQEPNFYKIFDPNNKSSILSEVKGHRAVGVVYDSNGDYRRNYVPTSLNNRYDAFIYLDETHALNPLAVNYDNKKFPETYPFGTRI